MKKALLPGVYIILFALTLVFPNYSMIPLALVVVINAIVLFKMPQTYIWVVFSTMIMANEVVALVNIILCISFSLTKARPRFSLQLFKKQEFIICIVLLVISLFFAVSYSAIFNFVFSGLYLMLVVMVYNFIDVDVSPEKLLSTIRSVTVLEFVCTGINAFHQKNLIPSDAFKATFSDAHDFGNWLILTIILYVVVSICYLKLDLIQMIKRDFVYFAMFLIMLYLCSAKALYAAVGLAMVMYFITNKIVFIRKNNLFWFFVLSYIFIAIILKILYLGPVEDFVSQKSDYFRLYIYESGWNYKPSYFKGTLFDELKGVHFLFGYGLGQYGSRFANVFAYETMWRADNIINKLVPVFFSAKCLPEYAKYIEFYTQQFVNEIAYRSAIISYPFSSFIAFIAETGVVGILSISYLLNKIFRNNKGKFLIYYFFVACIFDIFFDNIQCVFALVVYILFCNGLDKKQSICDIKIS